MGTACSGPFYADNLYAEFRSAATYRDLARDDFDRTLAFAATGGYALKTYDRFRKIIKAPDGLYRVRSAQVAQQHRMKAG
jgi:ATP-dependent Lhr-like helicase